MQEQLPGMRVGFDVVFPHPGPLPEGEGEKRDALFSGRVSKRAEPGVSPQIFIADQLIKE